ncbi:MAG TPA: Xaa-Pro dipeptidyl-peptidase [Nocardioidaceae bacterium]|nr:Xaa-Pro dipeptidyl-peptidase [Nocardioidaceae bacterium]
MHSPRPWVALTTAAVLSAGLLAVASSGTAGATSPQQTRPRFAGGMAQPVYGAAPADWIRQSLWVTTTTDSDRNGRPDRVHISVTRLRETRTRGLEVPVIYEVSPYYAGIRAARMHDVDVPLFAPAPRRPVATDADPRTWLPRGFAVVHADSLGTGSSTGCPTSGGRNETLGAKAVVDWLNGRAVARNRAGRVVRAGWSTGKVGMIGTSYNGTLPNAVAATGVEGLEAVVAVSAISSWYDYYRAGGAVVAPGGFQGEDTDVLARAVLTRARPSTCRPVLRRLTRRQDRRTGDYSAFWAQRNYVDDADRVRAAVLVAHGLRDWNVKTKHAGQWYAALRRAGVPHKIYLHQGGHGGLPPAGLLNRWFTHHLLGVDNGVQGAPHAYVRRPGGRLVSYREWPDRSAEPVDLRLRPRRATTRGRLVLGRPGRPVVERVVDTPRLTAGRLAAAPRSRHGRVYATAPLRTAVRLSGTPVARLRLSFGQRAANVSVGLVDYARNGRVRRVVTRGWRDPQNRGSLAVTRRVRPGRVYGLRVGLQPHDHVFARGHRIGLLVMSTDAQFTLRPPAGSTLALRTHRTSLRLPVVGGRPAVRRALARLN